MPRPSTASTSPATPTHPGKLPISSARWRRRDHGHNARHIPVADTRTSHPAQPVAGASTEQAPSRCGATSAIPTAESEAFEHAAPIQFAFLFAFSVPRSKHPRPADARSPSRDSSLTDVDSSPEASSCPLPQISSTRLGSGPRRHTLRASMYRIQRTNFKSRSRDHDCS